MRFETPPGRQAQVDFAHFRTVFTDEPGIERVVWLFSLVLGHSRMLWGRFVPQQDMQTVLRCHAAAFEALGGAPAESRMSIASMALSWPRSSCWMTPSSASSARGMRRRPCRKTCQQKAARRSATPNARLVTAPEKPSRPGSASAIVGLPTVAPDPSDGTMPSPT